MSASRVDRERARPLSRISVAAILAVAVLLAFLPALSSGFVIWDDDLNFTDNPNYRGLAPTNLYWMFTTLTGGHYHPLTWLTLGLDYLLWGMDARGYHATSLLLHAANAVCCYFLIVALIEAATTLPASRPTAGRDASWYRDPRRLRLSALAGALVFALHPLRVESAVWISERRDVLSGLFFLLTILAYLRAHAPAAPASGRRRLVLASLAFFLASLLSKAWGMTLPAVLLIVDEYPLRRRARGESLRALLIEKVPYALLAGTAAIVSFGAQSLTPEMRSVAQHGLVARLAQAAYGLAFYLWKTLLPIRLSPAYLLETPLDPTAPRYLLSAAIVVAITVAVILARRRAPWLLAAWACYVVVVSPVLGLAQTGPQIAADRYTYLSMVPFAALVAAGIGALSVKRSRLVAGVVGATLVLLGVLTFRQTLVWHDSLTLWNHTLALDPGNHIAWTNRGWTRQLGGDLAGAMDDYTHAIAANPHYPLAYYDRGTLRDERGDLDGAITDYSRVLELDEHDARALNNRAYARQRQGYLESAIVDYSRALAVAPPNWPYRTQVERNLAVAKEGLARFDLR